MAWRSFSRRRLARWLRGRWTLAALLRLSATDRDDLLWHAERLLKAKSYDDAERLFRLVEQLWPESRTAAWLGAGVCHQLRGALDRAEHLYSEVLAIEPDNSYARANRAEVRLLTDRIEAAREDLDRARSAPGRTAWPGSLARRIDALQRQAGNASAER